MSCVSSLTVYTARSVMSETLRPPPPLGGGVGGRGLRLPLPSGERGGVRGLRLPLPSGERAGVRGLRLPLPSGEGAGVRGTAGVRVQCLDDTLQNAFEILKDVIVPESEDPIAVTFQHRGTLGVSRVVNRVLASIELDQTPGLGTAEICNVPADRMLTPKLETEESTVTEARPQSLLGVGLTLPERSRSPHPALSPKGRGFPKYPFRTPSPFQGEGRGEGA